MTKEKVAPIMGYSVKLGKMVEIINGDFFYMKNGMKAYRGKSKENGDTIVKIVGKATPEELKKAGIKLKPKG